MPQTKRKKSAVEIYEQEQNRRPAGPRLSAVEIYENEQRQQPAQQMRFDLSGGKRPAPPPEQSAFGALMGGGAEAFGQYVAEPAVTLADALGSAMSVGDLGPLGNLAESAGRGLLKTVAAFDPAGNAYEPTAVEQDPRLAQLRAEREQRLSQTPAGQFVQQRRAELAAEAARDQTTKNKIARGVGRFVGAAAPAVATGVLTGGSLPAIAATTALQSAGAPEQMAMNVGLSVAPIPVGQMFKGATNAIRRVFGKGAAQIVEAEASGAVSPTVQRAMQQFEQAVAEINASGLSPAEKAAALETSIQVIGREASGVRPVSPQSRAGYPPPMEFPENPNPIQRAGILPGEGAAEIAPPAQPATSSTGFVEALGGFGKAMGDSLRKTMRESVARTGKLPGMERGSSVDRAYEGAVAAGAPRDVSTLDAVLDEIQRQHEATLRGAGASMRGPSASAPMDLNATVAQAAESIPRSKWQILKDEALGLLSVPKSLKSTLDISFPFRQGAILLLRPFQWRQSRKVIADMFRAFKTKNFDAINDAIASHPDAEIMKEAGLALQVGEEAFFKRSGSKISEVVGKTPGIKHSNQAYDTAANVQRVEAFQQYKRLIDKAGLSPEEAMKGYKAAAQWINIATGRGSLGKTLDKAMEGLNYFYFSPRFVASRLNVLNPVMYARNAATPGGRVVLRQQMGDLVQFASVVGTTLYLAKQAGADVTLNPHSPDFGKIKLGTWRYDLGAGMSQLMRMIYRVSEDFARAGRGEKPEFGKTAIDIGEQFLSYKLSPPAGVFRDFIKQRTVEGKPFTYGRAAADLVAPMQWADFLDAYQKEAWGGVAKSSFGATGIGVQNYEQTPVEAAIERAQPLFTELKRLDKQVSDLRKKTKQEFKNGKWVAVESEDDASFNARVQQFGQNYTLYGLQLLDSPRFRQAPDSVKVLALDALNEQAKKLTTAEFAFPELTLDANTLMDSAEATAAKRNPAK